MHSRATQKARENSNVNVYIISQACSIKVNQMGFILMSSSGAELFLYLLIRFVHCLLYTLHQWLGCTSGRPIVRMLIDSLCVDCSSAILASLSLLQSCSLVINNMIII